MSAAGATINLAQTNVRHRQRLLDRAWRHVRPRSVPWLFLLPALVIYGVFLAGPAIASFVYSLTNWSGAGAMHFVGLHNYASVFQNSEALEALKNTAIWAVVMVTVPAAIGLGLANLFRGKGWWKGPGLALIYLPAVLPMIGVAVIWDWIYNPQFGFLNSLLTKVGFGSLAVDWLGSATTALPALLVAAIWVGIGLPMVLYLAGIQAIPPELYEAARVDGGTRTQMFRHVTLPGLRQYHVIVIALQIIAALQVFAIVYALTQGGPGDQTEVLGTWMYYNIFSFRNVGYGSAIGWVLGAIALLVTIPYVLWMTRDE
jgi:raffinose/stachyose/melibiose transport system permease protein